uniref:Uncharacterized protein n=1 Tax=Heterorhabditis bacteriophora TaxID=37862 RepID=A0A1I7X7T1_HETBA
MISLSCEKKSNNGFYRKLRFTRMHEDSVNLLHREQSIKLLGTPRNARCHITSSSVRETLKDNAEKRCAILSKSIVKIIKRKHSICLDFKAGTGTIYTRTILVPQHFLSKKYI